MKRKSTLQMWDMIEQKIKKLGIKRNKLAEILEVVPSQVTFYFEKKNIELRRDQLINLADFFEIDINEFCYENDSEIKKISLKDLDLTIDKKKVIMRKLIEDNNFADYILFD